MEFSSDYKGREDTIVSFFTATFTDSEGTTEGKAIGALVRNLFVMTEDDDLLVFLAWHKEELAGAVVSTRLTYPKDQRTVFILGPIAVATEQQGRGIGQALLTHGLNELRVLGVDVAMTYGDPNYYTRVGFLAITEGVAQAPMPLRHPEGWLAQSLNCTPLIPLRGPSYCVTAFNSEAYW
ncbi:MAG: N-acetyltransferase [Rhodospirillales bacterium]